MKPMTGLPLSSQTGATPARPVLAGDALRDIKDVLPLPHVWPWWYWLAGVAVLAVLFFLVYFFLRTRARDKPAPESRPPDQVALEALQQAASLLEQGKAKQFAVTITDILRHYIEARFSLHAPALTTREFLSLVAGGRDPVSSELAAARDLLSAILQDCDLAKFAHAPLGRSEMQKIMDLATSFIRATRKRENQ